MIERPDQVCFYLRSCVDTRRADLHGQETIPSAAALPVRSYIRVSYKSDDLNKFEILATYVRLYEAEKR